MPPKASDVEWYTGLPVWAKMFMQLGFAAVVAFLFIADSRDRSTQLRDFYQETRNQARDDRTLFREELRLQREELKAAVTEMRRAVDALDANQRQLKRDVEDIRQPIYSPIPKEHK